MDTGISELESAVQTLVRVTLPLSDSDLGQPYRWEAHTGEGLRFAHLVILLELRTLAVQLAALRRDEGPLLTRAHHALAQYNSAYRDLQAALLSVSDEEWDRKPDAGEWPLRYVVGHMVGVERNFYALVDYGWRRQQAQDEISARLPDGEANRLLGEYAELHDIMEQGSKDEMLAYADNIHQLALTRFVAIADAQLEGPSIWWEEIPYSLEYRLHRFDAHLRQHTIQVDKTLTQFGHFPTEAERLLRLIYNALAEVEASLIGAADLGLAARQAQADRILGYADDVAKIIEGVGTLGTAVRQGDLARVRSLLEEDSFLVDAHDGNDVPMVRLALYYGQPEIAEALADGGASLALHDAAALGRIETVQSLLEDHGDWILNEFSRDGYTALQLASFFGQTAAVMLLLQRGANTGLVSRNTMQIQAIHAAAAGGHGAIVEALLQHGADPNAQQQDGFRPLHAAAQNGDLALAKLLVQHGADRSLTNAIGSTPYDVAMAVGHESVAAFLLVKS